MIRQMRLLMGLTQEKFAAHIDVTYPTINRWENGHFQMSPLAMEKFEQKLNEMGEQGKNLANKYSSLKRG